MSSERLSIREMVNRLRKNENLTSPEIAVIISEEFRKTTDSTVDKLPNRKYTEIEKEKQAGRSMFCEYKATEPTGAIVPETEKPTGMIEPESSYDIEKINQILTGCYKGKIKNQDKGRRYELIMKNTPSHRSDRGYSDKKGDWPVNGYNLPESDVSLSAGEIYNCLKNMKNRDFSMNDISVPDLIKELNQMGWSGNRTRGYKPPLGDAF